MKSPTPRSGSSEQRIIRELFLTKEGGLAPGTYREKYGRVFEELLIRELQLLTHLETDSDLQFARGYVVDDYAGSDSGDIDPNIEFEALSNGPRFDIVCYSGEVAWSSYSGWPMAIVPRSFAVGIIEAKWTLSPGYLPKNSSRAINEQLATQQSYLKELGIEVPLILVGAHYSGDRNEIQRRARADFVALLGDLSEKGSAVKTAHAGELQKVISLLMTGEVPLDDDEKAKREKVDDLQNIAKSLDTSKLDSE